MSSDETVQTVQSVDPVQRSQDTVISTGTGPSPDPGDEIRGTLFGHSFRTQVLLGDLSRSLAKSYGKLLDIWFTVALVSVLNFGLSLYDHSLTPVTGVLHGVSFLISGYYFLGTLKSKDSLEEKMSRYHRDRLEVSKGIQREGLTPNDRKWLDSIY